MARSHLLAQELAGIWMCATLASKFPIQKFENQPEPRPVAALRLPSHCSFRRLFIATNHHFSDISAPVRLCCCASAMLLQSFACLFRFCPIKTNENVSPTVRRGCHVIADAENHVIVLHIDSRQVPRSHSGHCFAVRWFTSARAAKEQVSRASRVRLTSLIGPRRFARFR